MWKRQTQRAQTGQGLAEYALILILVAVVVILILSLTGRDIGKLFGDIQCSVQYQRQAYVEWLEDRHAAVCYEDVVQSDGTTVKKEIGTLNL